MIADLAATATAPYVAWQDACTPQEVDQIVAIGDRLLAEAGAAALRESLCSVRMAGFPRSAETEAIYRKMQTLVMEANRQAYGFDLNGFSEVFQYMAYDAGDDGHYGWHVDRILSKPDRKLSFSLQLSQPEAYEGGDLQMLVGPEPVSAPRRRGTLVAYPSYMLHRVTTVTRGAYKALVIWTAGPGIR